MKLYPLYNNQLLLTSSSPTFVGLTLTAGPLDLSGKLTVGSFSSPIDVTATREYGVELHYSGNNYNVTGIRSRARLKTTDTAYTAQGALLQAANEDGIDAGVLNGALIEAIGKSDSTASTITMMRGCLVNTEWNAEEIITDLRILHVRTHTRDAATKGYISGTGYGIYIENEAVGGNGQVLSAGIYFKGTNLSAGNKAFTYGLDFSGATYGTAEIILSNGETIDNLTNGTIKLSGNLLIPDAGYIGSASNTTALQIEADGDILLSSRLGIGITPASLAPLHIATTNSPLEVYFDVYDDGSNRPNVYFRRSHHDTLGTLSETDGSESLGGILWQGVNSSTARATGGSITVSQDGVAGATYIPANIILVASSNSGHNTNQLVLHNDGNIGIATLTPAGILSIGDATEGGTASLNIQTAHETHTLGGGASSVTTTIDVPSGAMVLGASFCVNTAVTNDGDDSWTAAFSGGDATALGGGAAAQNTKVDTLVVPAITNAETNVTFTPQAGNFTAGVIEVVVYYIDLTSLADV